MKKIIKKLVVGLLAFTMALSSVPMSVLPAQASGMPSDMAGHWAQSAVTEWFAHGLGNGYPDGTFRPDRSVTRAEFAVMANKAFGIAPGGDAAFRDSKTSDWYYSNLAAAFNNGYIKGYMDGSVKPNKAITRQEAAVMLAKLLNLTTYATMQFTDSAQLPAWASGSVAAVANAGVVIGYPDGSFRGSRSISRAEAVVALLKATGNPVPIPSTIAVTAITCTPGAMHLTAGGITGTVTAMITPSNATNKNVTWMSSDMVVATVADGVVTPLKAGTTTITVTTVDGSKTATCDVTVAAGTSSGGGGGGGSSTTFTTTTSYITNDMIPLGLVGTSATSDTPAVATAAVITLDSVSKIAITSVKPGSATITVSEGANEAMIPVTVAADGSITIGAIVRYGPAVVSSATTTTADIITLTMDKALTAGSYPGANGFTVSGVATNPLVTNVAVSGKTVTLTLDKDIVTSDTAVKVSYNSLAVGITKLTGVDGDVASFTAQAVNNSL